MDDDYQIEEDTCPLRMKNVAQYGAWKIFLNGSQVNSFIGSSLPVFKDPQRENERYHQELNEK